MTGFNHTLTGAFIAVVAPSPLQPLVAFLSHFVLDALPHFGRHNGFKVGSRNFTVLITIDAVLCIAALGLSIFLFPQSWVMIALCAAAATLPDFLWAARPYAPAWMEPFYNFHYHIQWGERPYCWIYELIFTLLATSTLLWLAR